ncbi:MAG: hypothetical protein JO257_11895 [Deltaproteobacteria bacterium]|nr:hypothetical protein [Deltaproteobacteria bacterium]
MFAGLDVGHVVDQGVVHDPIVDVAGWVRINFRLDTTDAPDAAFFAAYDQVVDAYVSHGIEVYGLINDESVSSSLDHNGDAWRTVYVANATAIIDHFKNRVRTFELINEPNDWAGGTSARFTPHAFALAVQATYQAVKRDHADDRCWQVSLLSGPLFSFDGTTSADYLNQVYGEWAGDVPIDGIGYHMYVAQGLDSSTADVGTAMRTNLSAIWNTITAHEGAGTPTRIWVSEFGWQADTVGADEQAARMQAGFAAMQSFGKVAGAIYFNYADFPGASYGVKGRPAEAMLQAMPHVAHAAAVTQIAAPTLAPGELGEVVVTVENKGSTTWTGEFRLGAAPGCPDAAAQNAIAWEPAAGYVHSVTDARVYLPHDVAPGESIDLHIPVRAPDAEGTYVFAARMVHEGVTWFGATATTTVTVAAHGATGSGTTGGGSDTVDAPHSGGCATSHDASWLALVLAFARCVSGSSSRRRATPRRRTRKT